MSTHDFIPVIGLVGGVGSGKSAIACWLGTRLNVSIVDGDVIGHQVLGILETKEAIRRCFGDSVFDEQGEVNRKGLGQRVFGDSPEHRQSRADLEQIVHPVIREEIKQQIESARMSGKSEVVILDAAVLLEAGWNELCDAVIFVESSEQARLERVANNRGWDQKTLLAREASQMKLEKKRSASDAVIDNSGTLDESGLQLRQIIERIKKEHNTI